MLEGQKHHPSTADELRFEIKRLNARVTELEEGIDQIAHLLLQAPEPDAMTEEALDIANNLLA
jgi:hypothetical protein